MSWFKNFVKSLKWGKFTIQARKDPVTGEEIEGTEYEYYGFMFKTKF